MDRVKAGGCVYCIRKSEARKETNSVHLSDLMFCEIAGITGGRLLVENLQVAS